MDKVHHFGGFKEGLEVVLKQLRSDKTTSLILRGDVGSGKKTLIEEAESMCDVIPIHLNPYHYPDEYTGLKHIALRLGLGIRTSIQEIMEDLKEKTKTSSKKVLVVLEDFEGFCRPRQTLLYCLTNLVQHGYNISLIGLTCSVYWSENLEKRVRSRLLADFYELRLPYGNEKEYVKFASLLLGGYKIEGIFEEQLSYMWKTSVNGSIRELKKYLTSVCVPGKNGVWKLEKDVEKVRNPNNDMEEMAERLGWLTKPQLELLKIAVCDCHERDCRDFTLKHLQDFTSRHQYHSFSVGSSMALRNTALLIKCSLFKQTKPFQKVDELATFTLGITPKELKVIIRDNQDFQNFKTDAFWKRLR